MRAIRILLSSVLLFAGLATSCNNDIEETLLQEDSYLKIDATVDQITRGAIDATNFTKGDAIGIFVRDLEGKDYNAAILSSNIKATYDGNKWTLASAYPLSAGKEAIVYAYYPYNANAAVTGDSIDIDITKQEDVMYGSATGITVDNSTAKINFNHALARVTFAISKGANDVGEGKLTKVNVCNIESDLLLAGQAYVIATNGKMNIKNGNITARRYKGSGVSISKNLHLSEAETNVDCLLIPYHKNMTSQTRKIIQAIATPYVNLYLTIDGKDFRQKIDNPQWYAGQQYVYPININRTTDYSNIPADKVYMGSNADNGKPLYWASYNLGATKPEDYGGLYGWGDITGSCTSENLSDYPSANPPTDLNSSNYNLPAKKWGDGWRYPTNGEFWSLMANCNDEEFVVVNGVECVKFTSKVNGNVLYFPIAPVRIGTSVTVSKQSYYWLNQINKDDKSMAGTFYMDTYWKNAWPTAGKPRYYGLPIRPVTEIK